MARQYMTGKLNIKSDIDVLYITVNPEATPEEVIAVLESDQNLQVFAQATNGQRYGQSQSARTMPSRNDTRKSYVLRARSMN